MKLENGTTLTGNGLKLTLWDATCTTEAGSCAEDEWLYIWQTPEGRSHITTDIELAELLADGAKLGNPNDE